jgi:replicative DNA helicase
MSNADWLDKPKPASPETEETIIGMIFANNALMAQMVDLLTVDDFSVPANRHVINAMLELYRNDSTITPVLVATELQKHGRLQAAGGKTALSNMQYGIPVATNLAPYAKVVKDKSRLRATIRTFEKGLEECYAQEDTPDAIVDHAQTDLMALSQVNGRRVYSLPQTAARAREHLRSLSRGENPAIPTPWAQLNEACRGGMQKSELWGLLAVQKHGKSALAKQWAWHASGLGHRVLIFSREMSDLKIFYRLMAPLTDIPVSQVRYGLDKDRIERMIKTTTTMEDRGIFFDVDTADVDQAKVRIRELIRLEGVDMVIGDYANQFSGVRRKGASRAEEVAYIWRSFKNIAQEFQIGFFAVGHPTSDYEKAAPRSNGGRQAPYFHQSAESREAAKAVDVGMVLWTELSHGQAGARPATIYIDYQRDEEAGGQIPLLFDGRIMEFRSPNAPVIDFNSD